MPLFDDFPRDGRQYLLHEVGQPGFAGAGVYWPTVTATLRPIPDAVAIDALRPMAHLMVAAHSPGDLRVRIPAMLAPLLRLGSIYLDGDFQSPGPWYRRHLRRSLSPTHPLAQEPFALEGDSAESADAIAGLDSLDHAEARWGPSFAIDRGVARAPGYEIFRSFYAFHPLLAQAHLSGPWSLSQHSVFRVDRIEGQSVLGLRPSTPVSIAPQLHQLALHPGWIKAGEPLRRALQGFTAHERRGATHIPAAWPFDPRTRDMTVRGFRDPLHPTVFVILEIEDYAWRGPEVVRFHRIDASSRSTEMRAAGPKLWPNPEKAARGVAPPFGDPVSVGLTADPHLGAAPARLLTPGPRLIGGPEIEKLETEGSERLRPVCAAQAVIPIRPTAAQKDQAPPKRWAVASPGPAVKTRCSRFDEIARVINAARHAGALIASETVAPDGSPQERGDHVVWTFPQERLSASGRLIPAGWSRFKDDSDAVQWRTALVMRLETALGERAILITIEPKPAETVTYCSILFREPPETEIRAAIRALLRLGLERRGVWPDRAAVASCGALRLSKWKHWSEEASGDASSDVEVVLRVRPFLAHLEAVMRSEHAIDVALLPGS